MTNFKKALDLLNAVLLQNDEKDELQLEIAEFLNKDRRQFFLFGEEICNLATYFSVKKAINVAKSGAIAFTVYCWDEESTPIELLGAYNGNEEFMTLTETQYNEFKAIE